jgi:hypothetical protein
LLICILKKRPKGTVKYALFSLLSFSNFSKISLDPAVSSDDVGKLGLLAGEIQGGCAMERRFSVEAKAFCFMAKEGSTELRLEERRKGFVGVIRVGS